MKKQKTDESTSQAHSAKSAEDDTDSNTDTDSATSIFQNQSGLRQRGIAIVKK